MAYDDVEAELCRHPAVQECVVTRIEAGPGENPLVAYVVTTGTADPEQLRSFLSVAGVRRDRVPVAVIPLNSLPRNSVGEIDQAGLPLPVLPGAIAGGKAVPEEPGDAPVGWVMMALSVVIGLVAYLSTDYLWPGSTDLSGVPQVGYRRLLTGLYVAECLSFGLGVSFLLFGWPRVARLGRPGWLTTLAYLSIGWLLIAWWSQDNFYRLTAKTDWGRQVGLVYGYNITLMIAAAVLVVFAIREKRAD